MKIKHVYQPDDTGCGVACIAMIAGLSYQEVKDKMMNVGFFKNSENNFITNFKDVTTALKHFNINAHQRRKFKKWQNIPAKLAITSTNYNKLGNWHWVVFARDLEGYFIYDPGKRRKKIRDLRGKASGWFLEILNS